MRKHLLRYVGASLVAIAAMQTGQAVAQTNSSQDTQAQGDEADGVIYVTAQRREERLIDVPASVVALGAAALENQQISELQDFVGQVPNLQVNTFGGRSDTVRLFIRGIGQSDVTLTQDPSIALYVDGVYIGSTIGGGFETDDLARVEVLRGPQGTLYGRNATGGAVNLISAKPDPSKFLARGSVRVGNFDLARGNLTLNVPLTETLAVRGSVVRSKRDGWVENTGPGRDFNEQNQLATRVAVRWEPVSDLTLDYAYDYSKNKGTSNFPQPVAGAPLSLPIAAPFEVPGTFGLVQALTTINSRFTDTGPFSDKRIDRAESVRPILANDSSVEGHSFSAEYDVSRALTLRAIVGHRSVDNRQRSDGLPTSETSIVTTVIASGLPNVLPVGLVLNTIGPNALSYPDETTLFDSTSVELQALGTVSLAAGSLDYIVGGYYYTDDGEQDLFGSPLGAGNLSPADFTTVENETLAAFGQVTVRPFEDEKLSLTAGARYSRDDRAATRINERSFSFAALGGFTQENCTFFGAQGFFPPTAPCVPNGSVQQATYEGSFNNFSMSFNVAYKVNEDFNIYASYAEGFKSGGTSQRSANPINFANGFGSENVTSYEVGVKNFLFDRKVSTSFAAFYMKLNDYQLTAQSGATAGDRDFVPIDGNEIYGIEFDVTAQLSDSFRAGVTGALLQTTVGQSTVDLLLDTGQTVTLNLTDEQAYAPGLSGSAWAEYSQPLSSDLQFNAYASVSHQTSSLTGLVPTEGSDIDGRTLVDANIGLTRTLDGGATVGLRVWAKNLLDEEYQTVSLSGFGVTGATKVAEYGEPRTIGATLFFEF